MNEELLRIVVLSSVASWGATQAVKPAIKRWSPDSWRRAAVRMAALVLGSGIGFAIQADATGAAAGASGAAMSALIVAAIKRKLSK